MQCTLFILLCKHEQPAIGCQHPSLHYIIINPVRVPPCNCLGLHSLSQQTTDAFLGEQRHIIQTFWPRSHIYCMTMQVAGPTFPALLLHLHIMLYTNRQHMHARHKFTLSTVTMIYPTFGLLMLAGQEIIIQHAATVYLEFVVDKSLSYYAKKY